MVLESDPFFQFLFEVSVKSKNDVINFYKMFREIRAP